MQTVVERNEEWICCGGRKQNRNVVENPENEEQR
jgi:hypothetical protein